MAHTIVGSSWRAGWRELLLAGLLAMAATSCGAVPIPWQNCGAAGDIMQVTKTDASIWPPRYADGTPGAPPPFLSGNASFDPSTGQLTNLRIFFLLGPQWVFDSGPLATSVNSGFVALPASVPLTVTSPSPPILAGPYNDGVGITYNLPGELPFSYSEAANLGMTVNNPTATLAIKFNGTPGFPVPPVAGAYDVTIDITDPSLGKRLVCFHFPFAVNEDSAVISTPAAPMPTLSYDGELLLVLLVAVSGVLILGTARRRS